MKNQKKNNDLTRNSLCLRNTNNKFDNKELLVKWGLLGYKLTVCPYPDIKYGKKITKYYNPNLPMLIQNNHPNVFIDHTNNSNFIGCYLYQTNDEIYEQYFYHTKHNILCAENNGNTGIFCIYFMDDNIKGCIISVSSTVVFNIGKIKKFKPSLLPSFLSTIFTEYANFVFLKSPIKNELVNFCKNHSFLMDVVQIGIIYAKHTQKNGQIMLTNKHENTSLHYKNFLKIMGAPDIFDSDFIINDVFDANGLTENIYEIFGEEKDMPNIGIMWYISTIMVKKKIRQYIANTMPIIIYRENPDPTDNYAPFNTNFVEDLGIINQLFIIVERTIVDDDNYFRLGIFYRNMPVFEPYISEKYLFSEENIRGVIITKIYNGLINIRSRSKLSGFYLKPRYLDLQKMVTKYTRTPI